MCLISDIAINLDHLYLSGMWFGVDFKNRHWKAICFKEDWTTCLKYC